MATVLSEFIRRLGPRRANLELKWLTQAFHEHQNVTPFIQRRLAGEPLQYILGTQPFGSLDLLVRRPVLIPRPETEDWTIRLANHLRPTPQSPITLLDLCTGSGCIPLLLCHMWPQGSVRTYAVDVSPEALQLALDNATRCQVAVADLHAGLCDKVPTVADADADAEPRASLRDTINNTFTPFHADVLSPDFPRVLHNAHIGPLHVLTANPPYISRRDYEHRLSPSVRHFEDPRALLGDLPGTPSHAAHGLAFYSAIARLVRQGDVLRHDGLVVVEVGAGQARAVRHILRTQGGLSETHVWLDPWDRQRVVLARR